MPSSYYIAPIPASLQPAFAPRSGWHRRVFVDFLRFPSILRRNMGRFWGKCMTNAGEKYFSAKSFLKDALCFCAYFKLVQGVVAPLTSSESNSAHEVSVGNATPCTVCVCVMRCVRPSVLRFCILRALVHCFASLCSKRKWEKFCEKKSQTFLVEYLIWKSQKKSKTRELWVFYSLLSRNDALVSTKKFLSCKRFMLVMRVNINIWEYYISGSTPLIVALPPFVMDCRRCGMRWCI